MLKILQGINVLIAGMGVLHIVIGIMASAPTEAARVWFIGSGIAILVHSLSNFAAIQQLRDFGVVSNGWLASGVIVLGFVSYVCWVLPEPQNFLLLVLLVVQVSLSAAIVMSRLKRQACRRIADAPALPSGRR